MKTKKQQIINELCYTLIIVAVVFIIISISSCKKDVPVPVNCTPKSMNTIKYSLISNRQYDESEDIFVFGGQNMTSPVLNPNADTISVTFTDHIANGIPFIITGNALINGDTLTLTYSEYPYPSTHHTYMYYVKQAKYLKQ